MNKYVPYICTRLVPAAAGYYLYIRLFHKFRRVYHVRTVVTISSTEYHYPRNVIDVYIVIFASNADTSKNAWLENGRDSPSQRSIHGKMA